jgi:response regulator RpfG family c-di-GMP phosphodiesterase
MMRNNVREDRTGKHPVEEKLERAFSEIKLPDELRRIIVDEMDYFDTANSWNRFSEDSRLYVTYFHLARVGLLGLSAANFLGLSEDMKRDLFVAGTLHDIGKAWIFHPRNRDKNYQDFQDEMRNHPSYSVRDLLSKRQVLGEGVLGTIERHHCFQADPYPSDFMTDETPEAIYLAQILSAVDSYDSASTRANNRHRVPLLWRFVGSELPPRRKVQNLMLAEKGRIPIGYEGARHRTMGELIEDLYDNRVIGKGDPFNPEVTI